MKKLALIFSLFFFVGLAMNSVANEPVLTSTDNITIVDDNPDKKPCPENCTCENCTAKKADTKKECTKSTTQKSGCCAKKGEAPACQKKATETKKEKE